MTMAGELCKSSIVGLLMTKMIPNPLDRVERQHDLMPLTPFTAQDIIAVSLPWTAVINYQQSSYQDSTATIYSTQWLPNPPSQSITTSTSAALVVVKSSSKSTLVPLQIQDTNSTTKSVFERCRHRVQGGPLSLRRHLACRK